MKLSLKYAVLMTSVLIIGSPMITASPVMTTSPSTAMAATSSQTEAIARDVQKELNNLRNQNGEQSLDRVYELTYLAQTRANHLSNINSLDEHSGYNYLAGEPYTAVAGENIGYWYNSSVNDPEKIAKEIIADLYDDTGVSTFGHRKNMLNPYFKHVGIGVSVNPANGYIYYAQDFGTTNSELGNKWAGARAYSQYTSQVGLSSNYPTVYDRNSSSSSQTTDMGVRQINAVVTTSQLTPLTIGPNGKTDNRSLAKHTGWYTDKVFTDQNGHTWYRVSTSEWAQIDNANPEYL